jgi:hypothetical protein
MRHVPRTAALIALVAAAALPVACSDDSDSKRATPKTTGSAAATTASTAPPITAADDPASCIRGTFRFTQMDYAGPVQTQFGPTVIMGGIGGRRIELKPDNTFHFTDDGSDTVQFSLLGQAGNPPTNGTAVLKAESDGSFVPTGQTATSTSRR